MRSAQRSYDADVATQVPHAALRVYVMGERGADREPATEQDRQRMARAHRRGHCSAGAFGFSTSRTLNHKAADGRHIPTLRAEEAELTAIAHAMRDTGMGWLQIVSDFEDQQGEIGLFRRLAARIAPAGHDHACCSSTAGPTAGATLMGQIDEANAEGLRITAQIRSRPTSVLLGLELSQNPFIRRPSYKQIARLPFPERLARAARSRVPRPHPGRELRRPGARQARRALGPHVPVRRSARLRAEGREQHRRARRSARAARRRRWPTTC